MGPLEVIEIEKMRDILETFSWLDEIRWKAPSNYSLINYCQGDLTEDEKLLTHWLCYITDRRMPFERIWDVGGYVISHLVRSFTREDYPSMSDLLGEYVKRGKNDDGRDVLWLECDIESNNHVLARYGMTGLSVTFASRHMPEDLVLIFRTLQILNESYGKSLARYFIDTIQKEKNVRDAIALTAAALDELTYVVSGTVSAKNFDEMLNNALCAAASFSLPEKPRQNLFTRKRLWCSLRDYLKSPEFNNIFVNALHIEGFSEAGRWKSTEPSVQAALDVLELPGDTWNEAEVLRKGLISPNICNERKTWKMPRTIRIIHEFMKNKGSISFYPEKFDVTFDFVPRMCKKRMCDICSFGDGVESICHQNPKRLCAVVLVACGYRHVCSPHICIPKEGRTKGACASHMNMK